MASHIKSLAIVAGNEKKALVGVGASLVIWWVFVGSKKYGMKGQR